MEKEKEISPEIRTKIIQLIHNELEEIQGEDIFNTYFAIPSMGPVQVFCLTIKCNVDEQIIDRPDRISFELKFKDGEPNIKVYSFITWTERKEPYKKVWTWRGRKQLFTDYKEYTVITSINCGHIHFRLTQEEHQDLIKRTKASWDKYQSLKDITLDNKVLDKINLRLKK